MTLVTIVNRQQTVRFLMIPPPPPRRLPFLQSLLEPESQKHDWLALALSHDAPQRCDAMTPEGKPRSGLSVCRNSLFISAVSPASHGHLSLKVAFSLLHLGLRTPPVAPDPSSRRPALQTEDGRDLSRPRLLDGLPLPVP